jgi:hypothetical protein
MYYTIRLSLQQQPPCKPADLQPVGFVVLRCSVTVLKGRINIEIYFIENNRQHFVVFIVPFFVKIR